MSDDPVRVPEGLEAPAQTGVGYAHALTVAYIALVRVIERRAPGTADEVADLIKATSDRLVALPDPNPSTSPFLDYLLDRIHEDLRKIPSTTNPKGE